MTKPLNPVILWISRSRPALSEGSKDLGSTSKYFKEVSSQDRGTTYATTATIWEKTCKISMHLNLKWI